MIWERIRSNWAQYKASAREQWDRLDDAELDAIAGDRDKLVERLVEHYGLTPEQALHNVVRWENHITQNWFERSV